MLLYRRDDNCPSPKKSHPCNEVSRQRDARWAFRRLQAPPQFQAMHWHLHSRSASALRLLRPAIWARLLFRRGAVPASFPPKPHFAKRRHSHCSVGSAPVSAARQRLLPPTLAPANLVGQTCAPPDSSGDNPPRKSPQSPLNSRSPARSRLAGSARRALPRNLARELASSPLPVRPPAK